VKNDFLDLRVPVWVSDFSFFPNNENNKIAICTRYSQVRIYDIIAQKRPLFDFKIGENPLHSLVVDQQGRYVIVADSIGTISKIDLRNGKLLGLFKGNRGSIRGLENQDNLLASCGLDRFLRVWDIDQNKITNSIYLKQRLNFLLFTPKVEITVPIEEEEQKDETVFMDRVEPLTNDSQFFDQEDEVDVSQQSSKKRKTLQKKQGKSRTEKLKQKSSLNSSLLFILTIFTYYLFVIILGHNNNEIGEFLSFLF